ncbi:MAG: hypothetical protein ACK40X_14205 [Armatimonadota bacterium]
MLPLRDSATTILVILRPSPASGDATVILVVSRLDPMAVEFVSDDWQTVFACEG